MIYKTEVKKTADDYVIVLTPEMLNEVYIGMWIRREALKKEKMFRKADGQTVCLHLDKNTEEKIAAVNELVQQIERI